MFFFLKGGEDQSGETEMEEREGRGEKERRAQLMEATKQGRENGRTDTEPGEYQPGSRKKNKTGSGLENHNQRSTSKKSIVRERRPRFVFGEGIQEKCLGENLVVVTFPVIPEESSVWPAVGGKERGRLEFGGSGAGKLSKSLNTSDVGWED